MYWKQPGYRWILGILWGYAWALNTVSCSAVPQSDALSASEYLNRSKYTNPHADYNRRKQTRTLLFFNYNKYARGKKAECGVFILWEGRSVVFGSMASTTEACMRICIVWRFFFLGDQFGLSLVHKCNTVHKLRSKQKYNLQELSAFQMITTTHI